jgi:hypothetical protein
VSTVVVPSPATSVVVTASSSGRGSPARHRPALHDRPVPHVPQTPSQPSSPHCFPVQAGVQVAGSAHRPATVHFSGGWHAPQTPLQPSSPHSRPAHTGVQICGARHVPAWHSVPAPQVPHTPPQPLSPHSFPAHDGVHPSVAHRPAVQVFPVRQLPQVPVQPSGPHCLPVQSGVHAVPVQVPAWQVWPPRHVPHSPPQPSLPQSFPRQSGVQAPHSPQSSHAITQVLSHALSQQYESPAQTQASQAQPLQPASDDVVQPSLPLPGMQVPYWHDSPLPHDPQDPPQPSSPHSSKVQSGVQAMAGQSSAFRPSRVPHEYPPSSVQPQSEK